ncbi:hypothetical protein C4157_11340 [Clostridioides difficile]|nr:hypothetical protein DDG61_04140 [Clostridioides difficile]EHJ31794.1 hypothetical protein HMPREF1122_01350 [Clostridioides difficile 002-P50-2011]EHJ33608.1 hypothetical protein HMPREF1123_00385 [Clostridioides difficile 050-P50-2011]AWH80171.1 hypothetical protein DDG63_03925 [Clostridioides difficile]EGT2216514.1 hypothetical protein [Clostridioides difficile]
MNNKKDIVISKNVFFKTTRIKHIKYLLKVRIEYIKEILILYDLFNDKLSDKLLIKNTNL